MILTAWCEIYNVGEFDEESYEESYEGYDANSAKYTK
jgi:hypothetical protein